jgi:hypothetical protein
MGLFTVQSSPFHTQSLQIRETCVSGTARAYQDATKVMHLLALRLRLCPEARVPRTERRMDRHFEYRPEVL